MRYTLVAAVLLLLCAPAVAQSPPGGEIELNVPPGGPANGGDVLNDSFVAGVYLLIPKETVEFKGGMEFSTIVTFNADGCTDSLPLWDGPLGSEMSRNGAAHGTWRLMPRTREISTHLYYFTQTPAGLLDRLGKASLTANLNRDLSEGTGEIVFESFLPLQFPGALMEDGAEVPIGGRWTVEVRLVQLR